MVRKVIDRTGEERVNKFGSKMIIKEYRSSIDIDVYFPEYNWTFEHTQYSNFKNGTIKCPYERRFIDRTGEIGYNKQGFKMTIIRYRNNADIDIKFEDNIVVKHRRYKET